MLIWVLSCSGRSGNTTGEVTQPKQSMSEEISSRLIKIVSPEENTGFKLNQPVKIVLALENKSVIPDSVTILF